MSKSLYVRFELGAIHALKPTDYSSPLTYDGIAHSVIDKYALAKNNNKVEGAIDLFDYVELKPVQATLIRPPDITSANLKADYLFFSSGVSAWYSFTVPDNYQLRSIPGVVIDGGSGSGSGIGGILGFSTTAGVASSGPVTFDGAKLQSAVGSASLDALSDLATAGIKSAVKNVLAVKASDMGLTAAWDSFSKVDSVASALVNVHANAGNVLEQLFMNDAMSAQQAAVLIDNLFLQSQARLVTAAEKVTGSDSVASAVLKAAGYSAEILRSTSGAVGKEIKFKVYAGDAIQLETPDAVANYMHRVVVMDGESSSTVFGRWSNDVFAGGGGWDSFWGNAGNDAFVGGTGIDSAGYLGSKANFTISSANGIHTVMDKTGAEGTDALIGVERLYFSDGNIALDVDGNAGKAYRLYKSAFDRKPDEGGLGFQMQQLDYGASLSDVAQNFISSPEFAQTYGSLDNTKFVSQLYQNVLDRAPDASGLAFHTGNLASGASARASVLIGFSESPENQVAVIGSIQGGMLYQFP